MVHPPPILRIQYHMSSLTCNVSQLLNKETYLLGPLPQQQSLSVYRSCGADCPADRYLCINPSASPCRFSQLSEAVRTDTTSSPLSFPTFVHHAAVLAAAPCNFLVIFFVESIFNIEPYTEVASANRDGSRDQTSLT